MFPHHEVAIANVVTRFSAAQDILEIVLAGSLTVLGYREGERGDVSWPNRFLFGTEQSWMRDAASVEEL